MNYSLSMTQSANLIPWAAPDANEIKSMETIINQQIVNDYLSPRITHLDTTKQLIFGVRVCFGTNSPSFWISQPSVKHIMKMNNLQINFSNSRCSSGDVVTAGHILFKHPHHTHKHFYLMALRRQLPETTPFFDIGTHFIGPHRENRYHI
jgi:hypothetical protein